MSTFDGLIEEIPGISVDRFDGKNLMSSVFFLSHCHTDHMEGLCPQFFLRLQEKEQYLYCTPISRAILMSNPKNELINGRQNYIKLIDGCSPVVISYKLNKQTFFLTVCCVPAGHCPGSVMFVFENSSVRILYTGDFRIDANDFSKLKPLHEAINGQLKPIVFDNIYLDTTFFRSKFDYFPSRQDCLRKISKVVKDWIEKHPKNIVLLECSANYGPEHLFIGLSKELNIRIHVKDYVYQNYQVIPELNNCITNSPNTSIHACVGKNRFRKGCFCRSDVSDEFILTIVPSVYRWKDINLKKKSCEWDIDNRRFYSVYSCHASRGELFDFVHYFHPKKLYPCVCPARVEFSELQEELNNILSNPSGTNDIDWQLDLSKYRTPSETKLKPWRLSDDEDSDC